MARADDAIKGFERSHLSMKSVMEAITTPTERYENQIEQLNKWLEIGKLNQDEYSRAVDKARVSMEQTEQAAHGAAGGTAAFAEGVKNIASDFIPAITAAEALHKSFEAVKEGFENVADLEHGARRMGIAIEDFSRLRFAADAAHVSVQTFEGGFGRMLNGIEQAASGNKQLAATFDGLHLDIAKLKEENPAEAFLEISEAVSGMTNAAERAHAIREIFGRGGMELGPMLGQARELFSEADAAGFTRAAEDAERVEAAERQWAILTDEWKASMIDAAETIAPAFQFLAEGLMGMAGDDVAAQHTLRVDSGHISRLMEQLEAQGKVLQQATEMADKINAEEKYVSDLTKTYEALGKASRDAAAAGNEDLSQSLLKNALAMQQTRNAAADLLETLRDIDRHQQFAKSSMSSFMDFSGEDKQELAHQKAAALAPKPFSDILGTMGLGLEDFEKMTRQYQHMDEIRRRADEANSYESAQRKAAAVWDVFDREYKKHHTDSAVAKGFIEYMTGLPYEEFEALNKAGKPHSDRITQAMAYDPSLIDPRGLGGQDKVHEAVKEGNRHLANIEKKLPQLTRR